MFGVRTDSRGLRQPTALLAAGTIVANMHCTKPSDIGLRQVAKWLLVGRARVGLPMHDDKQRQWLELGGRNGRAIAPAASSAVGYLQATIVHCIPPFKIGIQSAIHPKKLLFFVARRLGICLQYRGGRFHSATTISDTGSSINASTSHCENDFANWISR